MSCSVDCISGDFLAYVLNYRLYFKHNKDYVTSRPCSNGCGRCGVISSCHQEDVTGVTKSHVISTTEATTKVTETTDATDATNATDATTVTECADDDSSSSSSGCGTTSSDEE